MSPVFLDTVGLIAAWDKGGDSFRGSIETAYSSLAADYRLWRESGKPAMSELQRRFSLVRKDVLSHQRKPKLDGQLFAPAKSDIGCGRYFSSAMNCRKCDSSNRTSLPKEAMKSAIRSRDG